MTRYRHHGSTIVRDCDKTRSQDASTYDKLRDQLRKQGSIPSLKQIAEANRLFWEKQTGVKQ